MSLVTRAWNQARQRRPDAGQPADSISEPVYYKQILTYSVIVVVAGPLLVWAALILPGW
ncbi:hypothetical protein [Terrabacter sp. Ter38]|uniref:hypothetical protein n=1 Tax=Terrabacter sp. Ter38 TaxID=2926030 RepID=UPI0021180777|nr:hypothetical protein [Terrabacter sp. Ter38]